VQVAYNTYMPLFCGEKRNVHVRGENCTPLVDLAGWTPDVMGLTDKNPALHAGRTGYYLGSGVMDRYPDRADIFFIVLLILICPFSAAYWANVVA
jgi:hypothetical protein